ncbi:radical SAM protein [Thermodesulfobacteriota bacterium]
MEKIFNGVLPIEGFYEEESDDLESFVWTKRRFKTKYYGKSGLFRVNLCYYGDNGVLSAHGENGEKTSMALYKGWHIYPFDLTGFQGGTIDFELSYLVKVKKDDRELGIMIRDFHEFEHPDEFHYLSRLFENKMLNHKEFISAHEELRSLPYKLRIDIENRCNIKPPCVYCEWDWVKHLEGQTEYKFTFDTIKELGPFFDLAEEVVDCSYGEPFLNNDLSNIISYISGKGKRIEFTSNGQILDEKNRSIILGKPLTIYVSIDSPTAEDYSIYRNDKFDVVIENLKALCAEKKKFGNMPRVITSYIVMHSNIHNVQPFIKEMENVGVDGIKLRCLYHGQRMMKTRIVRNNFEFIYKHETLLHSELAEVVERARSKAEKNGLMIYSELDFSNQVKPGHRPICKEPWETIYVLGRGIHCCCFSKDPLVPWSEQGDRTLEEFLRDSWNSPQYRELRTALAQGKLNKSCLESPSCPIVRKKAYESS